jgi:hypothetical protein
MAGTKRKLVVLFNKEAVAEGNPTEVVVEGTSIAFNQIGCILVMNGTEDVAGMFPAGMVAGVYEHPDGPNKVQLAAGILA